VILQDYLNNLKQIIHIKKSSLLSSCSDNTSNKINKDDSRDKIKSNQDSQVGKQNLAPLKTLNYP
jgi:hypothetical protein